MTEAPRHADRLTASSLCGMTFPYAHESCVLMLDDLQVCFQFHREERRYPRSSSIGRGGIGGECGCAQVIVRIGCAGCELLKFVTPFTMPMPCMASPMLPLCNRCPSDIVVLPCLLQYPHCADVGLPLPSPPCYAPTSPPSSTTRSRTTPSRSNDPRNCST